MKDYLLRLTAGIWLGQSKFLDHPVKPDDDTKVNRMMTPYRLITKITPILK